MPNCPLSVALVLLGGATCLLLGARSVDACDEALCASLVSKCLLLKSCECDMMNKTNCTCCKECHRCLSRLYTDCCDCVGMCPSKNPGTYKESLEQASSIEELKEPIPALFLALTEEEDPEQRWTIYTYPAHLDLLYFKPRGTNTKLDLESNLEGASEGHRIRHGLHHIRIDPDADSMNCTVAYHAQCMSLNKCKASCQSMGAARYRWFHQYGCCECIGSSCLHFGKGEALCLKCPLEADQEEETGGYYYNEYYPETDQDFYDEEMYKEENNQEELEEYEEEQEEQPSLEKNTKAPQFHHGQLGGQRSVNHGT